MVVVPVRLPPRPVGLSGPALFDRRSKSSAIRLALRLRVLDGNSLLGLPPVWPRPLVRSEIRLGPEGYPVWLRPRLLPTLWYHHRSPRWVRPLVARGLRGLIVNWLRALSHRPRFSSRLSRPWKRLRALRRSLTRRLHPCTAYRLSSSSHRDLRVPARPRHDHDPQSTIEWSLQASRSHRTVHPGDRL